MKLSVVQELWKVLYQIFPTISQKDIITIYCKTKLSIVQYLQKVHYQILLVVLQKDFIKLKAKIAIVYSVIALVFIMH